MSVSFPVFVTAYAKINFTLDVLGKRDDGYHRLASVMQTIALCDTIAFREQREKRDVTCSCDMAELESVENLATRAAILIRDLREDSAPGIALDVHKEIPTQAGLGGGSSDAACVLNALNAQWKLNLPPKRLEALGAELGSDVPFFIRGGTALIEGRGEIVTPLPDAEPLWLILVKPTVDVPTPGVFRRLTPREYSNGDDTAAVVQAIRRREPLPERHLTNALEAGVLRDYPQVEEARNALVAAGAPVVRMSGSGSTLYAPFRSLNAAAAALRELRIDDGRVWLTRTVTATEAQQGQRAFLHDDFEVLAK